jgi:MFS family permease
MLLFALTIFTSAFLLFLVQPLIAKQILPWFGGSAAVWTTCLVFFQVALLAGYAYADYTTRKLKPRTQVGLHIALLVFSLAFLPIIADTGWKPLDNEDPAWRIVGLLVATIGLPYFLLSTTGPLVQAWFARTFPTDSVYRLFALSNFASLLALLGYPFLLEPWVTLDWQAWGWSAGYALFVALCIAAGALSLRFAARFPQEQKIVEKLAAEGAKPTAFDYTIWLLLAALGSWLLLAITNHITQNIASIPFLWIVPLSLYLLTFILAFESEGWYSRKWFLGPLAVILCFAAYGLQSSSVTLDIKIAIPLYLTALFTACMFLNGELAALRPAPRYLTGFYLMISLGGALGGMFVGFVAPRVFTGYYELGLGFVALAVLAAVVLRKAPLFVWTTAIAVAGVTGHFWNEQIGQVRNDARVLTRNFYGTLKTRDTTAAEADDGVRRLIHGVILHGEQYLKPERRLEPTTYYGPSSGVGLAFQHLLPQGHRKIGVIGLGTGTIASWGRPGDELRFYEINPQVIELARREFTFLDEGKGRSETVLGDARLSLEREEPQNFDLLAIDAFSSDSIPTHLLTKEAMAVYLRHLNPDGILAFHVTNRFLNLAPVVEQLAVANGLFTALVSDEAEDTDLSRTDWVLVTRNPKLLGHDSLAKVRVEIEAIPGLRPWTDDFNNLFRILK